MMKLKKFKKPTNQKKNSAIRLQKDVVNAHCSVPIKVIYTGIYIKPKRQKPTVFN